jgi:hypothetical protein
MNEQIFFSSGEVSVSLTRFIVFGQTYAMSGVTSVRTNQVNPSRTLPFLLLLAGIGLMFAGSANAFGFGLVLLLVGGAIWAIQKPQYFVLLSSASGETRALKSKDREYVGSVVQALNDCIVARG